MQAAYARQYAALWEGHWWWRARTAFVLGWVERLHGRAPRGAILDVGCGDGLFFSRLQRFGRVMGLEPDPALVRDPRWRDRIRTVHLDEGFRAPEPFDLVLMLDVLEHIEDDRGALRAAFAALRPGGHLLLTVPALPGLWSRHDEANAHFRRYRAPALRQVLDEAGFAVETVRYFFFWTVLPLVLRRWLAPSGRGTADYAVAIPPAPINAALEALSRGEQWLGRWVRWPWGSSLLAVARRPGAPSRRGAKEGRHGERNPAQALLRARPPL